MSTGRHKNLPPGVPRAVMSGNLTPIHPLNFDRPPEVGNPPHLDIEETLREMYLTMQTLQLEVEKKGDSSSGSLQDEDFIASVAKSVSRKNVVGKTLMWIAGVVGTIFSAGMAYSVFIGANATDDEVANAVNGAIIEHNSGRDPHAINGNGDLVGSHPEMRNAINTLQQDTTKVKEDVADIKEAQKKSDKRSEYQYEFSRWQSEILECDRTRKCKAPKKPDALNKLESDIHLGKF